MILSGMVERNLEQGNLFDPDSVRSLLDRLLTDSRLYTNSQQYKELLDFVARMPNFAPFNAMLLQVQKPGLRFAASAYDWKKLFSRKPKEGARPLLILWPFSPVALVYDLMDTEGPDLPKDVWAFYARGPVDAQAISSFEKQLRKKYIQLNPVDAGDGRAGSIRVLRRANNKDESTSYQMNLNRNHPPAVQFNTVAHELAHLFLGHLGPDQKLKVPARQFTDQHQSELEAESVAYLVCARNNVASESQTYLANYVTRNTTVDCIDIYQIMRAASQVENLLELNKPTKFEDPKRVIHPKL